MTLNIKLLALFLMFSFTSLAQENQPIPETEKTQEEEKPSRKFGNINLGLYTPIAFGDNFVNNGMNLKPGIKFSFKVHIVENIFIGNYFSFFNASITNSEITGYYNNTTNYILGGVVGYEQDFDKWSVFVGLGIGYSIYDNNGIGDNFNDTATALWFNPEINYAFSKRFSAFVSPELRHDFMNIEAPSQIKDNFDHVSYLNIGFGIRLNMGGH